MEEPVFEDLLDNRWNLYGLYSYGSFKGHLKKERLR